MRYSIIVLIILVCAPAYGADYKDNQNGTIMDASSGFTWQKEDDSIQRTWQEAVKYCNDLELSGMEDWRLPSNYELRTIFDNAKQPPFIDTAFFPTAKSQDYWTSTEIPYYDNEAFYVNFGSGAENAMMTNKYFVRCVRGERIPAKPKKQISETPQK